MSFPSLPHTVNPGQGVVWSLPTTVTYGPADVGATNGSAFATTSSAELTMTSSGPLANWIWAATWGNFTTPSLPTGSVVDAIYPVILGYGTLAAGEVSCRAGNASLNIYAVNPGGQLLDVPGTIGAFSGQYTLGGTNSLGHTLADVTNARMAARLFDTAPDGFRLCVFNLTFIGLAVYYTAPPIVFGSQPIVSASVGNTRLLT